MTVLSFIVSAVSYLSLSYIYIYIIELDVALLSATRSTVGF